MKIVFAALDTYSLIGGLQNFNRRVIRALADLEFRPVVHLMRDKPYDLPKGISATLIAHGDCHFCFINRVLKAVRGSDVLLLGHINLLPIGVIAKFLNPRLQLVLFVHGDEVWNDSNYRKMRWYEPYLVRWINRILSVSAYTADRMAAAFHIPSNRFVIFPNAVDPTSELCAAPSKTQNILVVTRLAAHDGEKHVDSVIRAFARVAHQRPDARLEIIGEGVLRPALEALAHELNLGHQIFFYGRVSDTVLAETYAQARLFVLPSDKEGFGIVFLEAWLHALPVICGAQGASREIVSHGVDGFVADAKDIAELARQMDTLLGDYELACAMGMAGQKKVMTQYLDQHFRQRLRFVLNSLHHPS